MMWASGDWTDDTDQLVLVLQVSSAITAIPAAQDLESPLSTFDRAAVAARQRRRRRPARLCAPAAALAAPWLRAAGCAQQQQTR
jgi:hypothetical protein